MTAYKPPGHDERARLSREAKLKALDALRARPAPTEADIAEAKAARDRRETAERERRAARKAANKETAAARTEKLANARALAEETARAAAQEIVDRKAGRDARYAARKSRK